MKANQLFLEEVLDVNRRTGVIRLHEERVVLFSNEALGILSADLIHTLGIERAKGFLMRFGWSWGYRDAETLQAKYDWTSLKELLLAGPVMHTIAGVVTVEPDQIEITDDALFFSGYWRNSYEADLHLLKHGVREEFSCWSLLGYASGYLSASFGHKVLAYELTCRAKGDEACYFEARTVEHLDACHQKDLKYYKEESMNDILEDTYRQMELLHQHIDEAKQFRDLLTEHFLSDENIETTLSLLRDCLQKTVRVEKYGAILASSTVEPPLEQREEIRYPIVSKDELLGSLLIDVEEPLTQREELLVQQALVVLKIQMYHELKMMESIWTKRSNFIDDIVNGRFTSDLTLRHQAALFELDADASYMVVSFKLSRKEDSEEAVAYLSHHYEEFQTFMREGYVTMLISEQMEERYRLFATTILQEMTDQFPRSRIYIGVGREVEQLRDISKSYVDAKRLCDFLSLVYPHQNHMTNYSSVQSVMMFINNTNHDEMIEFYESVIGEIIEYDRDNETELLITLKIFLDYNGNLQQTADELHLSIAGLRYRLDRIEKLSKMDLKSGHDRFQYQFAIQIHFLLQII